jgi:hypothetical protein
LLSLVSFLATAQITLTHYDLPYRGETYYRHVATGFSSSEVPSGVYDSTGSAMYWDLSGIDAPTELDTLRYLWVEGTPDVFDFPDANMVDYDIENPNSYTYFIRNESGLYLSGNSGSFSAGTMGDFNIKAEFRPAVPIIKTPATYGDVVEAVSRSSVDISVLGNVKVTTHTRYYINGYGTVKIPGGEEHETLRLKRISKSVAIITISIGPTEIIDTSTTFITAYEFYGKKYGDMLAQFTISRDESLGLDQFGFLFKDQMARSGIEGQTTKPAKFSTRYLPENGTILVDNPLLEDGGSIYLYNTSGELVHAHHRSGASQSIPVGTLTDGLYLIMCNPINGIPETKTIVIQHQ